MRRAFTIACMGFALLCAATAADAQSKKEKQRAEEARLQALVDSTIPHCNSDALCARMWDAAQLWVQKNAGMKIQTVTNVIIETYNPAESSPGFGFTVRKEPAGPGLYKFVGAAVCRSWVGCSKEPLQAIYEFNLAVAAVYFQQ